MAARSSTGWNSRGSAATGGGALAAQARQLGALRAGARVGGQRARRRATLGSCARSAAASASVKRSGSTPLATTRSSTSPRSSSQRALELERLAHRHLLRAGDGDDAGPGLVGEHLVDRTRLAGDRPDPGHLAERARRAQDGEAVAGRGGVEDRRGRTARSPRAPLVLGELPHLADREQLAHAGRGGGEVGERAARGQHVGQRARGQLVDAGTPPSRPAGRSRRGAGPRRAPPRARRPRRRAHGARRCAR